MERLHGAGDRRSAAAAVSGAGKRRRVDSARDLRFDSRMFGALKKLFSGEDAETRAARLQMTTDLADPRRAFVWGVVAVSYKLDPGYLKAHATEAIRDWYGISSAQQLLGFRAEHFGTRSHPAYNQYRLVFLARAGFGAGLIDAETSWGWAMREAAVVQQHYGSWQDYGQGYVAGHLEYRASQGDPPARLEEIRGNLTTQLAAKQREVWVAVPFHTPMG
ncbi:MAG: DUF1266 domain-containing protein [Kofleriaceae bacterium]